MAYNLNSPAQEHLTTVGCAARSAPGSGHFFAECGPSPRSSLPPLVISPSESSGQREEDQVMCGFKKLSVNGVCTSTPPLTPIKSCPSPFPCAALCDRGSRPLPPLPISEDLCVDEADSEVELLTTSSDTDLLLEDSAPSDFKYDAPGRRSFRGCGQINYAYFDSPTVSVADLSCASDQNRVVPDPNPPPPQSHRRLRRSHSGPAGSFNKPAIRISSCTHRASPSSDEDKPEVPPRVPIPPRPAKPDYRRWSAEVTSNTYSDEDRPPKVPRENLCLGVTPVPQVLKAFRLTSMGSCPQHRASLLTPSMSAAKPCRDRAAKDLPTRFLASCPLLKMGRRLAQRIITYYLRGHRTWTNMKSILRKQKKQTQAPKFSHYLLPVVWPLPQKSWPPE